LQQFGNFVRDAYSSAKVHTYTTTHNQMHDCCTPGGGCSKTMEHVPEELMARFEELSALEHEFEDAEEEISKSHLSTMCAFATNARDLER
jgi:hypothetical protein